MFSYTFLQLGLVEFIAVVFQSSKQTWKQRTVQLTTMSVGFYFSISLRVALSCLINKRDIHMFTTSIWVSGHKWYAKPVPSNLPEGHLWGQSQPTRVQWALAVALVTRTAGNHRCLVSKYPLVILLKIAIYSGFTHWKWWFSIAMPVYQRVGF